MCLLPHAGDYVSWLRRSLLEVYRASFRPPPTSARATRSLLAPHLLSIAAFLVWFPVRQADVLPSLFALARPPACASAIGVKV